MNSCNGSRGYPAGPKAVLLHELTKTQCSVQTSSDCKLSFLIEKALFSSIREPSEFSSWAFFLNDNVPHFHHKSSLGATLSLLYVKPWAVVMRGVEWLKKSWVSALPTLKVYPSFLPTGRSKSSLINHSHPSYANSPTNSFSQVLCTGSTNSPSFRWKTTELTWRYLFWPNCALQGAVWCHLPAHSFWTTSNILQSSSTGNNEQ